MKASVHATALVLATRAGPRGVLLTGRSGAGKSALALSMIDEWWAGGRFAALVADDRVMLEAANGALLARAPAELAGLAERRGLGIVAVDRLAEARIHLHAHLGEAAERMPEPATSRLEGVEIERIDLPALDGALGAAAQPILRAALQRCT